MDENLNQLENRLIDHLDNTDFDYIDKRFSDLKEPTMFVGSGGSFAAAKFIASVINEKNGIISEAKLPDEVRVSRNNQYHNMIIVSNSAVNYGAQKAAEKAMNDGVKVQTLSGNSNISKDDNIVYGHSLKSESSFISFDATLAPMAIALAYYLEDKQKAIDFIRDAFEKIRKNLIKLVITDNYEFIGKDRFPGATAFVESAMTESGIAVPILTATYDACHGRTTSMLQQENRQLIYLLSPESTELDNMLHDRLFECGIRDRITDVSSVYSDTILADFYLTLQMIYICAVLARKKGIDLSSMTNSEGKRLHIPANSLAIKTWEELHPGVSFWDECRFRELNQLEVNGEKKAPGYYGPTGKFAEPDMGDPSRNSIVSNRRMS